MNLALWIVQAVLAVVFIGAGLMKLATPKAVLETKPGWGYVTERSATEMKLIGSAEVIGGIGVVVPWWLGIAPVLTPIAAAALAVIMAGAIATHRRRNESLAKPAVLGILALLVAVGRLA